MLFNVAASAPLFSADKLVRAALLSALCGRSHAQKSIRNAFGGESGGGGELPVNQRNHRLQRVLGPVEQPCNNHRNGVNNNNQGQASTHSSSGYRAGTVSVSVSLISKYPELVKAAAPHGRQLALRRQSEGSEDQNIS